MQPQPLLRTDSHPGLNGIALQLHVAADVFFRVIGDFHGQGRADLHQVPAVGEAAGEHRYDRGAEPPGQDGGDGRGAGPVAEKIHQNAALGRGVLIDGHADDLILFELGYNGFEPPLFGHHGIAAPLPEKPNDPVHAPAESCRRATMARG